MFINAPWDLRQLTNLETLSIDYEIIFSEDQDADPDDPDNLQFPYTLPESIEQLNIEGCKLEDDMIEHAYALLRATEKFNKLRFFELNYDTLEPADDSERDQLISLTMVAGIFEAEGIRMSIVDDEDKVLLPRPFFKVEDGPPNGGGDDWSDLSGSELGFSEGASDEDNEHDIDDEMNEDTNEKAQGRYNLRPR
ncbi:hypothetical protein KCU95_g6259, partial [Aureobasidium melanogenum]